VVAGPNRQGRPQDGFLRSVSPRACEYAMRESADVKAKRYLAEARLTVEQVDVNLVRATARGSGAVYDVGWTPEYGWSCSCPARGRCSHLLALMLVTVREGAS
jgi:SWIM zinc finger